MSRITATSTRRIALVGLAVVGLGGGGAAAIAASTDAPALGRSGASDAQAKTVAASPAPAEAAPSLASPRTPPVDVRNELGLLRREAAPADAVPADALDPIASLPGVEPKQARSVPTAPGADPFWIVPTSKTGQLFLVGPDRVAGYSAEALDRGMLLRVDESVADAPAAVVVTGLLRDGATRVRITTQAGDRQIVLRDSSYSVRFGISPAEQPRSLEWTDVDGDHSLPIPLSPDIPKS